MHATPMNLSALAVVALAGCGGNGNGAPPDAPVMPSPPALGAQLDRAGRPAISTLLIGTFAAEPTRTAVKDAYRRASDPMTWKTTMLRPNVSIEQELETNLAAFDALDTGMTSVLMAGCRNALRYITPTGPMSYQVAADMFADDELHVDTSLPTCEVFLALELEYGTGGGGGFAHTTCGGRMPSHDAIGMMYSVFAAGAYGVVQQSDGTLTPLLHDNAPVHGDLKDTFPFLGPPH
ncbi:MAG TPA: hypothetical protein VF469_12165 [Kofleriaceae bacterium]